mmetsp:Transcript_133842/g.325263  ORF Transcript_133842/g.325263 Transcript_133842/m.325263 type:complete len:468 (+) Transcript_133842:69-1472(+)
MGRLRRGAQIISALLIVGAAFWAYELGWGWTLQGGLARFCFDILDFNYDNGGGVYLTAPFVKGYWVESCRSVFAELDGEQRTLVEALFDRPLPQSVLSPAMTLARRGAAAFPVSAERKREQRRLLLESPPRAHAPQGPDRENLTRQVLAHAGGMEVDWLRMHASFDELGRPSQEPIVEPSEVGKALKEGRLVRFDATKVLPAHVFNVTLDSLAQMHGPDGDSISILAFLHEFKECRSKAHSHRKHFPVGALFCPPPPTLGEMRRSFPDPKLMPMASRIALRRLPRYIDEDKMLKDLGLEGVERPEGQIIMGHAMGDTHWDEQDNLFIQASGVSVVLGVPAEYADAIAGGEKYSAKSSGMIWDEWLKFDDVRRTAIPWYYMVLKPGDGIAIPSRSFHAVYGGHNRASVQTFLEPKFHGMRWKTNKDSYWYKETDTRQAVRNLYFKTAGRLWESRKLGIIAQGAIIEYL